MESVVTILLGALGGVISTVLMLLVANEWEEYQRRTTLERLRRSWSAERPWRRPSL